MTSGRSDIHALLDELEGHYAWDQGMRDSGVHDTARRAQLAAELDALPDTALRVGLSIWVRDHFLSDDALKQGYGWEDALQFCRWIDDGDYRA